MGGAISTMLSNLEREVSSTRYGNGICDTLDLLQHLEQAETYSPHLLDDIRRIADQTIERGQIEADRKLAALYRSLGRFDDPGEAYFILYFRTARKGYGVARAIRIAEFAMEGAAEHVVAALRSAIAAMREEAGSEGVQAEGCCRAYRHAAGVRAVMTSAFGAG